MYRVKSMNGIRKSGKVEKSTVCKLRQSCARLWCSADGVVAGVVAEHALGASDVAHVAGGVVDGALQGEEQVRGRMGGQHRCQYRCGERQATGSPCVGQRVLAERQPTLWQVL